MYVTNEAVGFLVACGGGFLLGVCCDFFRILRRAFKTPKFVVFIEDLLFFVIVICLSVFIALECNDGAVRVFSLIGEILGAIIYFFTLSKIVMRVAVTIINGIKKALKLVFSPVLKLFKVIYSIFLPIKAKCEKILNKFNTKIKIHLKS